MNRVFGSTLILAGTAIGAGMLGLPLVLVKVGIIPAILILILTWFVAYYSAMATATIILRSQQAVSIGTLSSLLAKSSKVKRILSHLCQAGMLLMTYSLMVAYLSGGSTIIQNLLDGSWAYDHVLMGFALFLTVILVLETKRIDHVNRILFFGLIGAMGVALVGIGSHLTGAALPQFGEKASEMGAWTLLIPVLYASFGFQLTVPSVIGYLELDPKSVRKSIFWGSLIPFFVYGIWIFVTLSVIYQDSHESYAQLAHTNDVGVFINQISQSVNWKGFRFLSWIVSMLAIITSAVGVGLGIKSYWKEKTSLMFVLKEKLRHHYVIECITGFAVVLIPFVVSIFMKDAFIRALAFAGMILTVLVLIIPLYLLYQSDDQREGRFYGLTENRLLRIVMLISGVIILLSEITNIFF